MKPVRQAPGPRGGPMGSLKEFRADRLGFLRRCHDDFGDAVTFRLGPLRSLMIRDPAAVEHVLVTKSRDFRKHFGLRLYRPLLGDGLVTSEGEFWLRQRRLIQPAFHKKLMAEYTAVMADRVAAMLAAWQDGQSVDMYAEMLQVTLHITMRVFFGVEWADTFSVIHESHVTALKCINRRIESVWQPPLWLPSPNNLRLRRSLKTLDGMMYRIISHGREHLGGRNDVLSMLLRARDEAGGAMSDRQIRDEVTTLFLAGHGTTALALAWSIHLLSRHPEIDAKLAAEADAVLGGRPPTAEAVPSLTYTGRVVKEAMRLYPPAYLIGREPLREVEVAGYSARPGTTVFVCQYAMHRNPTHFPDPDRFDPDRWADAAGLPRCAYLPFGAGPRTCIGNSFAETEAVLLLASMVQKYRFAPDGDVRLSPTITLRPAAGIPIALRRRESAVRAAS